MVFLKLNFTCDKYGEEFQQKIAYLAARNWEELDENYTYCVNCVEKRIKQRLKNKKIEVRLPLMKLVRMFSL